MLMSGFAGDLDGWRHAASRFGRHQLMLTTPHTAADKVAAHLTILRLAGDVDSLTTATRHLVNEGPATAVRQAASELDLAASTRTTVKADLALLAAGGDVVSELDADRHINWLLDTFGDPRGIPSPRIAISATDALAALRTLALAGSPPIRRRLIETILQLEPQGDEILARAWARVACGIPETDWTEQDAAKIADTADGHHEELMFPLLTLAAIRVPQARERILAAVDSGNTSALDFIGDVADLPSSIAERVMELARAKVAEQRAEAANGHQTFYSTDWGWWTTALSLCHRDVADWPAVLGYIEDPGLHPNHAVESVRCLAQHASDIPTEHRDRLVTILRGRAAQLAATKPPTTLDRLWVGFGARSGTLDDAIKWALATLTTNEAEGPRLVDLLTGNADDRRLAAAQLGEDRNPAHLEVLASLAYYTDAKVRFGAAEALGYWAAHDDSAEVDEVVAALLRDPGTRIPWAVVLGLGTHNSAAVRRLRQQLLGSCSARVRRRTESVLSTGSAS